MRLNAQVGRWVTASDVLFDNIHVAKHMARLTDGLFNPLVLPALIANGYDRSFESLSPRPEIPARLAPDWRGIELDFAARLVRLPAGGMMDLGGSAKGWTAQRIAAELVASGPCLVNIGGDVVVRGAPDGLPGWQIDIADPTSDDSLSTVWLRDAAIVTSGIDYRRWTGPDGQTRHHIINPVTGMPAETDVLTATIIHPDAATAEAYAKAVLLMGSETGLTWLDERWHAAGLVVRQDGEVVATTDFVSYLREGISL
ncbi:MAG: FAD:protein FMN transferase, partial [Anaerolineae bacterium]|nr:FAD:protein FMN transferase [Anaerolineae bacterium]